MDKLFKYEIILFILYKTSLSNIRIFKDTFLEGELQNHERITNSS
jgi:hypothetical protein